MPVAVLQDRADGLDSGEDPDLSGLEDAVEPAELRNFLGSTIPCVVNEFSRLGLDHKPVFEGGSLIPPDDAAVLSARTHYLGNSFG